MSDLNSQNLRAVIDELASVRDSVRLRAHLLNLESKTRWQELEVQLEVAEQTLCRDARDSIAKIRELTKSARSFVDRHVKAS